MNKEQLSGNISKVTGKIKEEAGKIIEDDKLQAEGKVQYLSGVLMEYYGKKKTWMFKTINGLLGSIEEKSDESKTKVKSKAKSKTKAQ